MKKNMMIVVAFLLVLVMLAGCGKTETQGAGTPTAAPNTDTVGSAATQPITETPDQTISEETEEDAEYEGDASSYYIDVVYAEQIRRYYTALSQKWDQNAYLAQPPNMAMTPGINVIRSVSKLPVVSLLSQKLLGVYVSAAVGIIVIKYNI